VLASVIGCGNNYRPVVSAINPVGPAAQPQKFAVVISSTGTTASPTPGLVTFVDFAGDTVLITANIGVDPYYLILNSGGTQGYTLNSDHTLTTFDVDTTLLTSNINQTTLLPNANPVSIFPEGINTYVADQGQNVISQFTGTLALSLQQQLQIPSAYTPIYTVGIASGPRSYAIAQKVGGGIGQVYTIETASNTFDPTPITVGSNPVYGIMTPDGKRAFIMNQGDGTVDSSGTVSVINAQTNLPDTPNQTISDPKAVNPIWADFAPVRSEMVVANAGDGTTPGSVSIVSIPLCNATALPTNPNCNATNPVDAAGFGTVLANVPVGVHPVMVGVLQDAANSRAYVVNGGNASLPCSSDGSAIAGQTTACTVSVIDLNTNTVTATIPLALNPNNAGAAFKNGHGNYLAVTSGTPTGKVYVTSPESNFMTVIRTDTDALDTTVPLQGLGVSVRVTAP
jgi:DNA-binding beta-propeller fold protein YncE